LSDGNSIPQLGLGVYEMTEKETYKSVKWALQAGYKHIDTAEWWAPAFMYENESEADLRGTRMKLLAVKPSTNISVRHVAPSTFCFPSLI